MNDKPHKNPLKPSKLLPHWQQMPKWKERSRRPIWYEPSLMCAYEKL